MKFIVDAQLPKSLSDFINSKGFDSVHTLSLPMRNKTPDNAIRDFAKNENRIVVTKDNDFLTSHLLHNQPKKLILIKSGNIANKDLLIVFEKYFEKIIDSMNDFSLIELHKTVMVIHA